MEILYKDRDLLVCVKPPRVLSTDEPGGLPELVRQELGDPKADVRTVHRLDRVVSGLMVLARNPAAASDLSRQIREGTFQKEYLAVVHGGPSVPEGTFRDLLGRDKAWKGHSGGGAGLQGPDSGGGPGQGAGAAAHRKDPSDPGPVCLPGDAPVRGAEVFGAE